MNLQAVETTSADDVYEKFRVTLGAIGLKYGKRDYPQLLDVIEDFELALMIKLKSKLKSIIRKDERNQNKMDVGDFDKGHNQQPDQEPEVIVTTPDGKSLPGIVLNLTPDSFNALVNIYSVLSPENTKALIIR